MEWISGLHQKTMQLDAYKFAVENQNPSQTHLKKNKKRNSNLT